MAKKETTGVDPFARLASKAKNLDKLFKTTNPNKETELAEGVYVGLVTKIRARSIGKANEEQSPAIGVETIALCDKDGLREDIWGKSAGGIFVIKETEKQTLGDAFGRFVYFMQDGLLVNTTGMSIASLRSDIDELNQLVTKTPHLVIITVSMGTNGRKNVNFGNAVPLEQIQELAGIKSKEIKSEFMGVSGKATSPKQEEPEDEDEDVEEDDEDVEETEDDDDDEETEEDEEEDEEEEEEEELEEEEEEEEEYTPPPKKPAPKQSAPAKKATAKKKK